MVRQYRAQVLWFDWKDASNKVGLPQTIGESIFTAWFLVVSITVNLLEILKSSYLKVTTFNQPSLSGHWSLTVRDCFIPDLNLHMSFRIIRKSVAIYFTKLSCHGITTLVFFRISLFLDNSNFIDAEWDNSMFVRYESSLSLKHFLTMIRIKATCLRQTRSNNILP